MSGNWKQKEEKDSCIHYMRALAIGKSIQSAVDSFVNHEEDLLQGRLEQSLIDSSELAAPLNGLYQYAIKNVYQAREVIEVEAMGYKVLGELIDFFMEWLTIHPPANPKKSPSCFRVPAYPGTTAGRLHAWRTCLIIFPE